MKGTNWGDLFSSKPPFKPRAKSPIWPREKTEEDLVLEIKEKNEETVLMRWNSIQNLFNGFSYDIWGEISKENTTKLTIPEPKLSARPSAWSLHSLEEGYTFDSTAIFKDEEEKLIWKQDL